jgi:hypothetical protein
MMAAMPQTPTPPSDPPDDPPPGDPPRAGPPASGGPPPGRPAAADHRPVLPQRSSDETDAAWGEWPEPDDDERLRQDRPPHYDR